jgi:predicted transcriptional regulator
MADGGRVRIPIDLDDDLATALDRLAQVLKQDRAWVVARALRRYLDTDGARILDEAAAQASLDRGEGHDLDDVMAECRAIIETAKTRALRKAV